MKNKSKTPKIFIDKQSSPRRGNDHLPLYCDYGCSHAEFPQPDASGACRRDLAVYCALFNRHNNKNFQCLGRKQ
jgi:hypothetical protein